MERLIRCIRILFGGFVNARLSDENLAAYVLVLEGIPIHELEATIKTVLSEPRDFVPTPGAIVEAHRKMYSDYDPSKAEAGWESVKAAIRGVGSWGTPTFKDPLVARVVRAMGWDELCNSDKQSVDRAHFLKFYESFAEGMVQEERITPEFRRLRDQYREAKARPQLTEREGASNE